MHNSQPDQPSNPHPDEGGTSPRGPVVDKSAPEGRSREFTRFLVSGLEGQTHEIDPDNPTACPLFSLPDPPYALLRQFVANELGQREAEGKASAHIAYMRSQELVDYCDASEKGHYKWYPKGVLIQRLLLDYAARLAHEWGAFEMKNPLLIRGGQNAIGELMGEFHERDYRVDGGHGIGYLRYASDPLAFPFLQNVRFTHKQTPLKVYEEAVCFRNEQEGEVSGLKRVRQFLMTDMHAACASVEQAREEFVRLCHRFADLMNGIIAKGRWVLGWEGTEEFFEQHGEWLVSLSASLGAPAFFKLMPRMTHYYAMKNEFQALTADGANVQVSTVQWDVKDGERFDIGYVDAEGAKRPCPVILHASSFGSIERTLCAILENIAHDASQGVPPSFPFWLAPTQVRIVPVSNQFVDFALEIAGRLAKAGLRADVDDREETVGKRVRAAEHEWVPVILVVGEKEQDSGIFSVRKRGQAEVENLTLDAMVERLRGESVDMPFRPLPLPIRVSQRPVFYG